MEVILLVLTQGLKLFNIVKGIVLLLLLLLSLSLLLFVVIWLFFAYRLLDRGYLIGGKKIEMKVDKKTEEDNDASDSKDGKKVYTIVYIGWGMCSSNCLPAKFMSLYTDQPMCVCESIICLATIHVSDLALLFWPYSISYTFLCCLCVHIFLRSVTVNVGWIE